MKRRSFLTALGLAPLVSVFTQGESLRQVAGLAEWKPLPVGIDFSKVYHGGRFLYVFGDTSTEVWGLSSPDGPFERVDVSREGNSRNDLKK